jgi:hypothetical protein
MSHCLFLIKVIYLFFNGIIIPDNKLNPTVIIVLGVFYFYFYLCFGVFINVFVFLFFKKKI